MRTESRFPFAPVILALALFCICMWCAWRIWENHLQAVEHARSLKMEYDALQDREESLRALLRLAPCEAGEKMADLIK